MNQCTPLCLPSYQHVADLLTGEKSSQSKGLKKSPRTEFILLEIDDRNAEGYQPPPWDASFVMLSAVVRDFSLLLTTVQYLNAFIPLTPLSRCSLVRFNYYG